MAAGPTARTLCELKRMGCIAQVVERWNAYARVRQDLFGFADVLAISAGAGGDGPLRVRGLAAIQCTTGDHHASRREKILGEPRAFAWLKAGGIIQIWSWSKAGPRGAVKKWRARVETIVPSDFQAEGGMKGSAA